MQNLLQPFYLFNNQIYRWIILILFILVFRIVFSVMNFVIFRLHHRNQNGKTIDCPCYLIINDYNKSSVTWILIRQLGTTFNRVLVVNWFTHIWHVIKKHILYWIFKIIINYFQKIYKLSYSRVILNLIFKF